MRSHLLEILSTLVQHKPSSCTVSATSATAWPEICARDAAKRENESSVSQPRNNNTVTAAGKRYIRDFVYPCANCRTGVLQ